MNIYFVIPLFGVSLRWQLFMAWKKFTLRLKWNLYNRLRIYAEDNGMNVADAIRFIITKYLKDNNVI